MRQRSHLGDDVTTGLPMNRCKECGHVSFPPSVLCTTCHACVFETLAATTGVIATITLWSSEGRTLQFAEIKTDLGPTVVALVVGEDAAIGGTVIFQQSRYPVANTTSDEYPEKASKKFS